MSRKRKAEEDDPNCRPTKQPLRRQTKVLHAMITIRGPYNQEYHWYMERPITHYTRRDLVRTIMMNFWFGDSGKREQDLLIAIDGVRVEGWFLSWPDRELIGCAGVDNGSVILVA